MKWVWTSTVVLDMTIKPLLLRGYRSGPEQAPGASDSRLALQAQRSRVHGRRRSAPPGVGQARVAAGDAGHGCEPTENQSATRANAAASCVGSVKA